MLFVASNFLMYIKINFLYHELKLSFNLPNDTNYLDSQYDLSANASGNGFR